MRLYRRKDRGNTLHRTKMCTGGMGRHLARVVWITEPEYQAASEARTARALGHALSPDTTAVLCKCVLGFYDDTKRKG